MPRKRQQMCKLQYDGVNNSRWTVKTCSFVGIYLSVNSSINPWKLKSRVKLSFFSWLNKLIQQKRRGKEGKFLKSCNRIAWYAKAKWSIHTKSLELVKSVIGAIIKPNFLLMYLYLYTPNRPKSANARKIRTVFTSEIDKFSFPIAFSAKLSCFDWLSRTRTSFKPMAK